MKKILKVVAWSIIISAYVGAFIFGVVAIGIWQTLLVFAVAGVLAWAALHIEGKI